MIDTHYLRTLFLSIITVVCLVIGFVLFIDPYSILSDKPHLWRHVSRFEDPWRDGRAMRLAVLLRQPQTIVLGSSRVAIGVNVRRLKDTEYWPAYNAGTYNSSLAHRLSMLKYAALVDRRLKHVIIEVSPLDIVHAPDFWLLKPIKPAIGNIFTEAFPLIFSDVAVRDAIRVMWSGIENNTATSSTLCGQPRLRLTGTLRMGLRTLHESALVSYRMFSPQSSVDSAWKPTVDSVVSTCHQNNLDCTFFISPMNARILYGYFRSNQWHEIESMIKYLATTNITTYDFLWFNHLTDESNDIVTSVWIDSIHHSTLIGDAILDAISGQTTNILQKHILFTKLHPKTINLDLERLRSQRNKWVSKHPEIEWSYKSLLSNLKNPVLVSDVSTKNKVLRININDRKWIVNQSKKTGGKITGHQFRSANHEGDISGWAADIQRGKTAEHVAIVYRNSVVAWGRPWADMSDDKQLGNAYARSGFQFVYHLPMNEAPGSNLRAFALFSDGSALELLSDNNVLTW